MIRDRGFSRASRRIACRLLLSPSLVTVQVFTTHKSAAAPSAASRYPIRANPSRTSSVSYWLTLQPRVRVLSVAGIESDCGKSQLAADEIDDATGEARAECFLDEYGYAPVFANQVLVGVIRRVELNGCICFDPQACPGREFPLQHGPVGKLGGCRRYR